MHAGPVNEPPPLPDDDVLVAALARVSEAVLLGFRSALADFEAAVADGVPMFLVHPSKRSAENVISMPWWAYDDLLWNALQAARRLIAAAELARLWLQELPRSGRELTEGSVAQAAAFLDTIHHRERIVDGLIADAFENGTFQAALSRLSLALPVSS